MGHIFDLMLGEAFTCHQVSQVGHVKLFVEHFFSDWSDLVDFNDSSGHTRLLFPTIKGIADPS